MKPLLLTALINSAVMDLSAEWAVVWTELFSDRLYNDSTVVVWTQLFSDRVIR